MILEDAPFALVRRISVIQLAACWDGLPIIVAERFSQNVPLLALALHAAF